MFTRWAHARDLFDANPSQCNKEAEDLLLVPGLSGELRIRTMVLLACSADDWYRGEYYRSEAVDLLAAVQQSYRSNKDPVVKATLDSLHSDLEELATWQAEETPDDLVARMFGAVDVDDEEQDIEEIMEVGEEYVFLGVPDKSAVEQEGLRDAQEEDDLMQFSKEAGGERVVKTSPAQNISNSQRIATLVPGLNPAASSFSPVASRSSPAPAS
jgi:hypothetical protein